MSGSKPPSSRFKGRFLMLFQTCTKLTFDLSYKLVITVIARNSINSVGSLFFSDRILRFGENMPSSLKRFLSNFNVVAIYTGLIVDQVTTIFRLQSQYPKYVVIHLHGSPQGKHFMQNMELK